MKALIALCVRLYRSGEVCPRCAAVFAHEASALLTATRRPAEAAEKEETT